MKTFPWKRWRKLFSPYPSPFFVCYYVIIICTTMNDLKPVIITLIEIKSSSICLTRQLRWRIFPISLDLQCPSFKLVGVFGALETSMFNLQGCLLAQTNRLGALFYKFGAGWPLCSYFLYVFPYQWGRFCCERRRWRRVVWAAGSPATAYKWRPMGHSSS